MISLQAAADICYSGYYPTHSTLSLLLDYGEPIGWQDFGEFGKVELFNLRKDIPGHPKGSTVSRQTLETAIREIHGTKGTDGTYGTTTLTEKPQDFHAIE